MKGIISFLLVRGFLGCMRGERIKYRKIIKNIILYWNIVIEYEFYFYEMYFVELIEILKIDGKIFFKIL